MTAQDLKNSILQRAIEGKLVPQRQEEGTTKELLAKIRAEKARLIKEKKIKKSKPLPVITDDEKPFDIPESWEWVRLGEVSTYGQKINKIVVENMKPDMWLLDMEDIEKGTGRIIRHKLVKSSMIRGDKAVFHKGDLLYSKLRPYLKKILIAPEDGICTSELVPFQVYQGINPLYAIWWLHSPSVDQKVNTASYGVKMPRVGKETMINLLLPLPPLAEQHRIVAKIEELLPDIDAYDKAQTKLQSIEQRFPGAMKKSLLQYAIEGKLVPQRKEEGTAKELLAKIRAEKARLIKEKKIKKSKPLPVITDDEKPFDIPESWEWVRLGELGEWCSGATPSRQHPEYFGGKIPWLKTGDL
ncbi:MAG: restriction endonuclease subunit S, partial [Selenomonas bovis]|nr:restriction endonuclease subunit S [Selenomonas bovis]